MTAFICATPYHIFNAVNLKQQLFLNDDADLFLMNHMSGIQDIAKKIIDTGMFKNVFIIEDCAGSNNVHGVKLALYFFRHFVAVKNSMHQCKQTFAYKTLVLNCPDAVTNELFVKAARRAAHCNVIYIEDGIATYTIDMESYPKKLKYFFSIFGLKGFKQYVNATYFYRPELVQTSCPSPTQLASPTEDAKKNINSVFAFTQENDFLQKKFVLFEESFSQDGVVLNDLELLIEAANCLDKTECLLKKHPRSTSERTQAIGIDLMCGYAPWELYCLNYDFSDNVLIAISSTALLNPKLIFDCEPTIIFLYKLLKPKAAYHTKEVIQHIENVKKLYRGKNFYIPESHEELKKILSDIKGERD